MKSYKLLILHLLLLLLTNSAFIDLIGMGDLIDGLVVKQPTIDSFGGPSTAYMLDPKISAFLMRFNTRT
jgi:hypothetical protein